MAEELQLQVLQEMQRQMQDLRAEMAAIRADRGNGAGRQSVQSVNNEVANPENRGESNRPTRENGTREVTNASRRNTQGGGRNMENQAGQNMGNQAGHNVENHQGRNVGNRPGYNVENPIPMNNAVHEDYLALVERLDQAEGLHPFTATVMRAPMHENKLLPIMEKYEAITDPEKHLRSFVDVIAIYSLDDSVWCRVFSLSLKDEALDWFHSLQPETADRFATLRYLFNQQYASNRTQGLTYLALVRMRQGREETLKAFMDRFNQTVRQIRNVDQKLIIGAPTMMLRPRPFVDFLYAEELQTLAELRIRQQCLFELRRGVLSNKHKEKKCFCRPDQTVGGRMEGEC
ncbi:uncharacterized protein LOC124848277 [Vigna umbellata]|uniref:uncharacterized protein LOC124848277 n=1 Tax=Vigna umbellata TaxID=87088 RepID=UPI001F5FA565|nr:uncharacterized protein LOC124848277 [Vigna umbellata]